jgi:hypothetical protein
MRATARVPQHLQTLRPSLPTAENGGLADPVSGPSKNGDPQACHRI